MNLLLLRNQAPFLDMIYKKAKIIASQFMAPRPQLPIQFNLFMGLWMGGLGEGVGACGP